MERNTLLIVDDIDINREMLKFIFEEQFEILEAGDGDTAIQLLEEQGDKIALMFLDVIMPGKSGLDVLEYMVEKKFMDYIPVIIITGEASADTELKAYEYGASDIVYKPFTPKVVMRRTMNLIELFSQRIDIEKKLEKRTRQLRESREKLKKNNDFLINALSSVVEFRFRIRGTYPACEILYQCAVKISGQILSGVQAVRRGCGVDYQRICLA